MPFYLNPDDTVLVTIGGQRPSEALPQIPSAVADAVRLHHAQRLEVDACDAARRGDWDAFLAAFPPQKADGDAAIPIWEIRESEVERLPAAGAYEYKVVALSELGGFATAKGTAGRLEAALNGLASQGWEFVGVTERNARYIGGESVLAILRRFSVTEQGFRARFEAEERIRRAVLRDLDEGRDGPLP